MAVIDSSWGSSHLARSEIFNEQFKEIFQEELFAQNYVNFIESFDGSATYKISSIGELTVDQAEEGVPLPERRMDTGQFNFTVDEYVGVKVPFTDEGFEDNFLQQQALSRTPEKMARALNEYLETRVFQQQRKQTSNNANMINGQRHRLVASGANRILDLKDFAYAKIALKKANVPMTGLVAVVDPATEFNLNITSNIVDVSNNPMWEGIITTGLGNGMRFIRNIYGFDVYVSDFLDKAETAESSLTTYTGTSASHTVGDVANLFFSAANREDLPFLGSFLRTPSIRSWRDEDKRTEYYETTARFGFGLFRPENLVTIHSSEVLSA